MSARPIVIANLEDKAKAATPGPWEGLSGRYVSIWDGSYPQVYRAAREADFEHIRNADPDTVLRLCACLRDLLENTGADPAAYQRNIAILVRHGIVLGEDK